jgi:hypothetical protein
LHPGEIGIQQAQIDHAPGGEWLGIIDVETMDDPILLRGQRRTETVRELDIGAEDEERLHRFAAVGVPEAPQMAE